jgi:hypothetical protein
MAPGVSLLHPQMVRVRPDKSVTPADAGFAQISQRCTPLPRMRMTGVR